MEQNNDIKKIKVHSLMILDESGSMQAIYNAALTGANETIQTIRAAGEEHPDQDHHFTFVTFNSINPGGKTVFNDIPIGEVRDLTTGDYRPNACTPLYDAMGNAITTLEKKVKEGESVLVTIITDGYENASREYSGAAVKAMVDRLRKKGWTFAYIGANQDSVEVARGLGIQNSLDFRADEMSTKEMWEIHRRASRIHYSRINVREKQESFEDFFKEDEKIKK